MFQRIEKICNFQKGLDYDRESVTFLNEKGYKNIYFFDLNQPKDIDFKPDIIVFADTLEHLMNLEIALTSLKRLMTSDTELIITVPNATMLLRFLGNFKGVIDEHLDHKVSFTHSSLVQLVNFNGLRAEEVLLAAELNINDSHYISKDEDNQIKKESFIFRLKRKVYYLFYYKLVKFFPLFSECMIITCKLDKK